MIYLDNAATTRKKPYSVYTAMLHYSLFMGGNAGRGVNGLSLGGINTILSAQESAAKLFGMRDEGNIIFTLNATYALNMAILGTLSHDDHIVVTAMDHNSVLRPAALHGNYSVAKADKSGFVSPLSVRKCIKPNTKLVVCTHVSNVCGTRQNVAEIARTAHENGALFLLDASQSAGTTEVNMEKTGADMIACPGHKGLMGPMGTGGLYVKEGIKITPIIEGGTGSLSESLTQPDFFPDMLESGTLNVPAIAGLGAAAEFIQNVGEEEIGAYEKKLLMRFEEKIRNIHGIKIYGNNTRHNICAMNIGNRDCVEVATRFNDEYGVCVRAGLHCAILAHKSLKTEKTGCVRFSFGYFNTPKEVDFAADAVHKISKDLQFCQN